MAQGSILRPHLSSESLQTTYLTQFFFFSFFCYHQMKKTDTTYNRPGQLMMTAVIKRK